MRHLKELMIGISILALIGCAAQQKAAPGQAIPEIEETASMEGRPALVNQIGEDFYVYDHDGRYYVIHSAKMARKLKGSGHPALHPHPHRQRTAGQDGCLRGRQEEGGIRPAPDGPVPDKFDLVRTHPFPTLGGWSARPVSAWATWRPRGTIRYPVPLSRLPVRSGPFCGLVRYAGWRLAVPALTAGSGKCRRRRQGK